MMLQHWADLVLSSRADDFKETDSWPDFSTDNLSHRCWAASGYLIPALVKKDSSAAEYWED
jgi:hypothetical protein